MSEIDRITAALFWLELAGIAVFAASGALTASRKQMDLGGFAVIATVTAIGGGTIRDLLVGVRPVFWVSEPVYPVTCIVVAVLLFFAAPLFESRLRVLLWADAVGLSLFCATGTEKAFQADAPAVAAVLMGVITATFGGIARDVLCAEVPLILRKEIYATAALAGAMMYALLSWGGFDRLTSTLSAFSLCFMIRGIAIARGLSLPAYGHLPGRTYDEAVAIARDKRTEVE
jgi:uncharacterized membrane protein YeiH